MGRPSPQFWVRELKSVSDGNEDHMEGAVPAGSHEG